MEMVFIKSQIQNDMIGKCDTVKLNVVAIDCDWYIVKQNTSKKDSETKSYCFYMIHEYLIKNKVLSKYSNIKFEKVSHSYKYKGNIYICNNLLNQKEINFLSSHLSKIIFISIINKNYF